ncbi:hypothetical protein ScPMuIL_000429 [Solemya velum]
MAFSASNFDSLPDNIALEIFSYLPVKELCVAGSVCRRWRRITNDNSLWRYVDLLPYRLNLQKTWKVLRAHFSECLRVIRFKGFIGTGVSKWKKHTVSDAMIADLKDRCPNLHEFHLASCNTDNLDSLKLPTTLQKLVLHNCTWQPRWLRGTSNNLISSLSWIDLTGCSRVDNFDLEDISKFSKLEVLILNNCYRVGETGMNHIAASLTHITHLEVSGTMCNDLSIHKMSRNLSKLEYLNISQCPEITQSSLMTIASGLKKLKHIDISHGMNLKLESLFCLSELKYLRVLITGSELSDNDIKILKDRLLKCDIKCKEKNVK